MQRHPYSFEVPHAVDDLGLSVYAHRLYCHLQRLREQSSNATPSVREIATRIAMSVGSVVNARRELVVAGLALEIPGVEPAQAAFLLRAKNPQAMIDGREWFTKKCEWCRGMTARLHSHHYPVPKSEGGTETVEICPNCHSEYHEMVSGSVQLL